MSRVHDMGGQTGFGPVPVRPAAAGELDAGRLAGLVTRNGLIGTALV